MKYFFIYGAILFLLPLSLNAQEIRQPIENDSITFEQAKQQAQAIADKCEEEAFAGLEDEDFNLTFKEQGFQLFAPLNGKPAPDMDILNRYENKNICIKNKMIEIVEKRFTDDEEKKEEVIEIINNFYSAMTAFYAEALPRSAKLLGLMDYRSIIGCQGEKLEENLAELILYTSGGFL